MTRKEALQELLVKVKADLDTAHHHAAAFPSESAYGHCTWHDSHKASSGSLDAAISLFEGVLPGNWIVFGIDQDSARRWYVTLSDTTGKVGHIPHVGHPTKPARALLIATLEALVAMGGK